MLLIVTHKNTKNSIFLKLKNPITMHIAHVIGFLFLLKIREIFIFNIMFTAFIKILPVGELAEHFHLATTNTNGGHTHTLSLRQRHGSNGGSGQASYGDGDVWGGTVVGTTNNSGNHTHTITVNNTGDGNAHNNMQPYYTCYMWHRTA